MIDPIIAIDIAIALVSVLTGYVLGWLSRQARVDELEEDKKALRERYWDAVGANADTVAAAHRAADEQQIAVSIEIEELQKQLKIAQASSKCWRQAAGKGSK